MRAPEARLKAARGKEKERRRAKLVGHGGGRRWASRGLCPSGSLDQTGMFVPAAPGMDGIWSARLRGQSPCAVPEGHSPLDGRREPPTPLSAPLSRIKQTFV